MERTGKNFRFPGQRSYGTVNLDFWAPSPEGGGLARFRRPPRRLLSRPDDPYLGNVGA